MIRVLVVEDEALVAIDVARQLRAVGYKVVGPAPSVAKALKFGEVGCVAAPEEYPPPRSAAGIRYGTAR